MKFLALQTDVEVLKKQFIPEGEHEIMTVTRHPVIFVLDFIWKTAVFIIVIFFLSAAFAFFQNLANPFIFILFFVLLTLGYFYTIAVSYIAWRYNFLIITTDKIIIIDHYSFFRQKMNSVHLDMVLRSKFSTQFLGLFHCGTIYIHLDEKNEGSTRIVKVTTVIAPDAVVGAIESAIALKQQREPGTETIDEQKEKVEEIKETLEATTPEEPPSVDIPK
jgi:hypothetical protein